MSNASIVNSLVLRFQVYLEYQFFRVYQVFQDSKVHKLQQLLPHHLFLNNQLVHHLLLIQEQFHYVYFEILIYDLVMVNSFGIS